MRTAVRSGAGSALVTTVNATVIAKPVTVEADASVPVAAPHHPPDSSWVVANQGECKQVNDDQTERKTSHQQLHTTPQALDYCTTN